MQKTKKDNLNVRHSLNGIGNSKVLHAEKLERENTLQILRIIELRKYKYKESSDISNNI